jgi:hypothetical protein
MENKTRNYPLFSVCGLNCGLCPRFHTTGTSKCPGCAGEGFSEVHPPCGALTCCQRKEFEYCFLCHEYPCKKFVSADLTDSFITHKNQFRDLDKAKRIGMETYKAELNEKVMLLEELLKNHDDGRRKSFYCLAVNLLELADVKSVMENIADATYDVKEKATIAVRLFEKMAEQRGVLLKLRKIIKKSTIKNQTK